MNWGVFDGAGAAIIIHVVATVLALALGTCMWLRAKGTPSHRFIGRAFVALMLVAAFSAIFIRRINDGQFSWIHLFIPLTFFAAFQTFYYIRKKDIPRHTRTVKGLFFGALIIPGIFSFMPGRMMWHLFFG